jgi:hypothetical protein
VPQALPGVTSSSPPVGAVGSRTAPGFLRVVSPAQLDFDEQERLAAMSRANRPNQPAPNDLGNYIRNRWQYFRNQRNSTRNPLNDRLLRAQRMFEGQYDPEKLNEILKFGGSQVYSRLVAVKCRGATSLLRDVYLSGERPWDLTPQPDPPVPPAIMSSIAKLLASQAASMKAQGQPVDPDIIRQRYVAMVHGATQQAREQAITQAQSAADRMDDILQAGGFYDALGEFLVDLALFPFACIKGPTVRMVSKLVWQGNTPQMQTVPQMFWERVDPFQLYWDPGCISIESAEIIERKRLTRADLNQVMNLPGYDQNAIRGALEDYANGLRDWMDVTDVEQALLTGRESPSQNFSHLIECAEYHGNIQGQVLLDNGVPRAQIPDLDRDYMVSSWVVGRWTIKTQIDPSPRQRHPYYVSSFEKVPGTVAGHGLADILEDIQEVANATLRALVNNMSIASGPQVVINTELLDPSTNEDNLYPWKRWKVLADPLGSTQKPVDFFQPNSNAQELMTIYSAVSSLGDDISAIPRYITGESLKGGAGRTASGLSMLMGNAQKVLQTVAANVDEDVIHGVLTQLYDMIMLTDTSGLLSGNEQIQVNGVVVAIQKETEQQKQLQFLQITANPMDADIVGEVGRARVLRALATGLGLPDDIVPDDEQIQQQVDAKKQMQSMVIASNMAATQAKAAGEQGGAQSQPPPGTPLTAAGTPGNPAANTQGMQTPMPPPPSLAQVAPPVNTVSPQAGG